MDRELRVNWIHPLAFCCQIADSWRVKSHRTSGTRSSTKKSKAVEWPREIRQGSAAVKIYRQSRDTGEFFTVAHYMDGKRSRQTFAEEAAAVAFATQTASRIARGDREALKVTDADWRIYSLAREALAESGTAIDVACREFADARKILGQTPLSEAARFFVRHNDEEIVQRSVPEIVEDMIVAKKNAGVGIRAINDYKSRLRRFAAAFQCPISSITKDDIQGFLNGLKIAPRTKKNFKANIATLFEYARSNKHLQRDRKTEAEHLDSIVSTGTDIEVFTPSAFSKLISNSDADLVPYLAIRAFAGIRDSEINRMEWRHVKWEEGHIEVPAAAAKKTRSKKSHRLRRLVPIQPNLAQWLAPYRGRTGKICAFYNSERMARGLADKLGIRWVHNGLRHGYGSYRVALQRDYPKVAYEMGNSVDVIKSSYDQVVTPREATAWFAIAPTAPKNVVALPAAAVG